MSVTCNLSAFQTAVENPSSVSPCIGTAMGNQSTAPLTVVLLVHLQEAALRQHGQAQQSVSSLASRAAAEQAAAGHLPCQPCRTHLPSVGHQARKQQTQQQPRHAGQDTSASRMICSASDSVHTVTVNQGQDAEAATDASHGNAVSTLCPAKTSTSDSAVHQSEAVSASFTTAEAVQAAVTEAADGGTTIQTGASPQRGCQQDDKPTCTSAAFLLANRPSGLVISQSRAEPEQAGSEPGQQHATPSTPGTEQGLLQEQPCTPGLVSSSSACCALPRSCSSNGGDSCGSGLEAENSIRFRKRSKFEALKARREEARHKAEVSRTICM